MPSRVASPGSTQGRKSDAASLGNWSARLPRSPFGSMAMTGILSSAASSISDTPSPVLPDPVMPTMNACVVRSVES